jgi:hypothetical protein
MTRVGQTGNAQDDHRAGVGVKPRPFEPTLVLTKVGGRDDRRVWRGDGLGRPTVS